MALLVAQAMVYVPPLVTVAGLAVKLPIVGAATTLTVAVDAEPAVPAALYGVIVQVLVPVPEVGTTQPL